MTVWLIRAGSHGEYEQKFLQECRVYVTWSGLDVNIRELSTRDDLAAILREQTPDAKPKRILNNVSQIWPFAHEMEKGDWVVMPLKSQRAIQIGELTGDYHFEPEGPNPYYHWRPLKWIGEAIPRDHFGKDLLNSFGAFMTICRIKKNNAAQRLLAMRENGWKPEKSKAVIANQAASDATEDSSELDADLEELADDGIAKLIMSRFKGHGLTRLVEGILQAQGYTTWRSPEGADGGADILAGAGPLGFGNPRLCVEVKSESAPIDRPTVDKLLGAVTKFGAQEGLFVSWSGFKTTVQKEMAPSFFRVRLWTQKELLEALFSVYDKLDDDLKAELPLKRIWTVALHDEDE
jgi:restriction system protein